MKMHRMTHTKFEIQLVKILRNGDIPHNLCVENIDPYLGFNYPGGFKAATKDGNKFAKWLANRIANHEVFVKLIKSRIYVFGDSSVYLAKLKEMSPVVKKPESLYSCIRCKSDVKGLNADSLCYSCASKERNDEAIERSNMQSLHGGY